MANYVNNEEFLKELKSLQKTNNISEKLHLIFFQIAKNYSRIKAFRNYSYIDDMVIEAYINCVIMAKKFDVEKGKNPFAYFTTVIHRNFLNFIAKEKKQELRKWKGMKQIYEKYQIENGIFLTLPDNIIDKMYGE